MVKNKKWLVAAGMLVAIAPLAYYCGRMDAPLPETAQRGITPPEKVENTPDLPETVGRLRLNKKGQVDLESLPAFLHFLKQENVTLLYSILPSGEEVLVAHKGGASMNLLWSDTRFPHLSGKMDFELMGTQQDNILLHQRFMRLGLDDQHLGATLLAGFSYAGDSSAAVFDAALPTSVSIEGAMSSSMFFDLAHAGAAKVLFENGRQVMAAGHPAKAREPR